MVLQQNRLRWYEHVLQKNDNDWVKKYMEYEAVGSRPRGHPKRTWLEVVQRDCQVRALSNDNAMVRGRGSQCRDDSDKERQSGLLN